MRYFRILMIVLCVMWIPTVGWCAVQVTNPAAKLQVDEMENAARQWLELLDEEKFESAFQQWSPFYPGSHAGRNWRKWIRQQREGFSHLDSRTLRNLTYEKPVIDVGYPSLADDLLYVVVSFQSQFDSLSQRIETVRMMRTYQGWRVVDYVNRDFFQ